MHHDDFYESFSFLVQEKKKRKSRIVILWHFNTSSTVRASDLYGDIEIVLSKTQKRDISLKNVSAHNPNFLLNSPKRKKARNILPKPDALTPFPPSDAGNSPLLVLIVSHPRTLGRVAGLKPTKRGEMFLMYRSEYRAWNQGLISPCAPPERADFGMLGIRGEGGMGLGMCRVV